MNWHIINAVNITAELCIICFYFSKLMRLKERASKTLTGLGYAAAGVLLFFSGIVFTVAGEAAIKIIIFLVLLLSLANAFYRVSFPKSLLYCLIFVIIVIISDIILISLLAFLGIGTPGDVVSEGNSGHIAGIIGTKILYFWLSVYICQIINKDGSDLRMQHWATILIMPIISVLILYIIFISLILNATERQMIVYIVSILGLLYLNISVFDFIEAYSSKLRLAILEQALKSEKANYALLEDSYGELRSLKHDIKNQFSIIQELLSNTDNIAAEKAFEGMKMTFDKYETVYYTGDVLVDTIINIKASEARKKGIEFSANIVTNRSNINSIELARVLGNALDNSIEACDRLASDNKNIKLDIAWKNAKYVITIINSSDYVNVSNLFTTKKNPLSHGIGMMKSIKSSVEKMNGVIAFKYENKEFRVDIVI